MNIYTIDRTASALLEPRYHEVGVMKVPGGQNYDRQITYQCEAAMEDGPILYREYGHGGKSTPMTGYCETCDKEVKYRISAIVVEDEPPLVCHWCAAAPAYDEVGWAPHLGRWVLTPMGWECPACT